jgi:hypothetical protein
MTKPQATKTKAEATPDTYHVNKYRVRVPDNNKKITPQEVLNIFNVTHYALRESFLNLVQSANPTHIVIANKIEDVTLFMNPDFASRMIDVYDVLAEFNINNPALQHGMKKILMCGRRGHKDTTEDLYDIISALSRS